jgi:hypothetical protein
VPVETDEAAQVAGLGEDAVEAGWVLFLEPPSEIPGPAGPGQRVAAGTLVTLDGSASTWRSTAGSSARSDLEGGPQGWWPRATSAAARRAWRVK